MADPHEEASLALARRLAREECSPSKRPAKRPGRVEINLCSPDPPAAKKSRRSPEAGAQDLAAIPSPPAPVPDPGAQGVAASPSPPALAPVLATRPPDRLTSKTYLDCPFREKNDAKAAGAKWDPDRKKWYAEAGASRERFRRWLPGGSAGGGSALTLPASTAQPVPVLAQALVAFNPRLCALASVLPVQHEKWTCGYANLGALLQCITRAGRRDLPTQTEPAALQALVERAWREGFDPQSAAQFGGKLVGKRGRGGWIGTTEMAVVLWHLRVDAFIVEIVVEGGERRSGAPLLEAVQACLSPPRGAPGGGGSFVTSLPIVLQQDKHSRTLLGVTATSPRGGAELVLRDPNHTEGDVRTMAPSDFDGQAYQLIIVRGSGEHRLTDAEARRRQGEVNAGAIWRSGKWATVEWCPLRLR